MRYASLFSFYGSKSKLSRLYPPPKYPVIVEPFAGSAAYSLQYYDRQVILVEVNPRVTAVWKFLLSAEAEHWVRRIPDHVEPGTIVDDLIPDAPDGLREILRAEANRGTFGTKGIRKQVTRIGAANWHRIKQKILWFLPKIRHWQIIEGDHSNAPNIRATWFIDPPYFTEAGKQYACCDLNSSLLRDWVLSRKGQVIVCGTAEQNWLPFSPLAPARTFNYRSRSRRAMEAIWYAEIY